eukprot:4715545-Amphidinium_carterae.1
MTATTGQPAITKQSGCEQVVDGEELHVTHHNTCLQKARKAKTKSPIYLPEEVCKRARAVLEVQAPLAVIPGQSKPDWVAASWL